MRLIGSEFVFDVVGMKLLKDYRIPFQRRWHCSYQRERFRIERQNAINDEVTWAEAKEVVNDRFEVENVGGTVRVLLLLATVVDWRRGIDRYSFLPFSLVSSFFF